MVRGENTVRPTGVVEVKTDDIHDLPYPITIPIKLHIRSMQNAIRSGGRAGPVSVARADGKLYPVDKLDVLHAYRELGSDTVPCVVTDVATLSEAQLLHIDNSRSLAVNPFTLHHAVDYVRARDDGSMTVNVDDWEYMKIARLPLVPEIKERMSEYITSLGERMEYIPSFFAALRMVSRLDDAVQVRAIDMVIGSCDRMLQLSDYYTGPDLVSLEGQLAQFRPRQKPRQPEGLADNDGGYAKDGDEGGGGRYARDGRGAGTKTHMAPKNNGTDADSSDDGVKVREGKEKLEYYHTVDPNSIHFKCKRDNEYVFNGRSLTVREHVDMGRFISLEGDHGSRMYAIRPDAAEYLELSMQPSIQYYFTSNKQHGATVIITKKNLSEETLDKIKAILRGA